MASHDDSISTDRARLDLDVIHRVISSSFWAPGRTRDRVALAIEHSMPFGLFRGDEQIGFARVITDYVVLAFLSDVFVLDTHQGKAWAPGWSRS